MKTTTRKRLSLLLSLLAVCAACVACKEPTQAQTDDSTQNTTLEALETDVLSPFGPKLEELLSKGSYENMEEFAASLRQTEAALGNGTSWELATVQADVGMTHVQLRIDALESLSGTAFAAVYVGDTLARYTFQNVDLTAGENTVALEIGSTTDHEKVLCSLFSTAKESAVIAKTVVAKKPFSDELEPTYPTKSAITRDAQEIYDALTPASLKMTDELITSRFGVVSMYKNYGFDLGQGITDDTGMRHITDNFPQTYSTTMKSEITGNADHTFSIDACWNVKIPFDAPRAPLSGDSFIIKNSQLAVVSTKDNPGGQGTGIAMVSGSSTSPRVSIYTQWEGQPVSFTASLPVDGDASRQINTNTSSDRHVIFVDTDKKISIQTFKTGVADEAMSAEFDLSSTASSYPIELDGIGNEGKASTTSVRVPHSGFTIKSSELKDDGTWIEHALGGAIGRMCYGRVYPAIGTDGKDLASDPNRGGLPYGGILTLDPDLDLAAFYESGKLSLPGYKILKAMQEYGLYNIDMAGGDSGSLIYTSTFASDWQGGEVYNVPSQGNKQGYHEVQYELIAFLSGDAFFGLEEAPQLYVTVPVVKYATMDVNGDGNIDEADQTLVKNCIGQAITVDNYLCDTNQDGSIDETDVDLFARYFAGEPYHTPEYVRVVTNSFANGRLIINGANRQSATGYEVVKNKWAVLSAYPEPGYRFVRWTGDFANEAESSVILRPSDTLTIGAVFEKLPDVSLEIAASEGGKVRVSTDGGNVYRSNQGTYGNGQAVELVARPDDGYVFIGWKGDVSGFNPTKPLLMTKDTKVEAVFAKQLFENPYLKSSWTELNMVKESVYEIKTSKKQVAFKTYSTNARLINNAKVSGDYEYRVRMDMTIGQTSGGNEMIILFDFADKKNYCRLRGYSNGKIYLEQYIDGKSALLADYDLGKTVVECPMDFEILRQGDTVTVNGYDENTKITYFENIKVGEAKDVSCGVGNISNGSLFFTNLSLTQP